MTNYDPPMATTGAARTSSRILRLAEVQRVVPYSKMHIYRLEKSGAFPRRIRFGAGRVGWWEDEVLAWVESKRPASAA